MGKVAKRHHTALIPEACDRHANKLDIYLTKGRLYHVNFRNLQIRLTREQFEEWRKGFAVAAAKLQGKMEHDTLEPWIEPEQTK